MTDIADLSATELLAAYRAKTLSPLEVAKDTFARIHATHEAVNAFLIVDEERGLAAARASEARWMAGAPKGVIDGVPVTIKDNIALAGHPCRRGSAVSSAAIEPQDAPASARLKEEGGVVLGKTTLPEYGWKGLGDSPLSGETRNPWNTSRTPGGSSAGAAVAAALNLGSLHLGTDGAGSIRMPAAFCGVVGLKPTFGRVPAHPISVMGFLAHLGPITRTVADSALMLQVLARPDSRDVTAVLAEGADWSRGLDDGIDGLRIAWSADLGYGRVDREVADVAVEAVAALTEAGAIVEAVDPGFDDPIATLDTLWRSGAALALRPYSAEERARMDPGLIAEAEAGEKISAAAFVEAFLYQRAALAARMAAFFERYHLLVTPSLATTAFESGLNTPGDGRFGRTWTNWTPFTYPFNITGDPAISVPAGLSPDGLPVGLQFVGRHGADALVLRAARALEKRRPFARVKAPVKGA